MDLLKIRLSLILGLLGYWVLVEKVRLSPPDTEILGYWLHDTGILATRYWDTEILATRYWDTGILATRYWDTGYQADNFKTPPSVKHRMKTFVKIS